MDTPPPDRHRCDAGFPAAAVVRAMRPPCAPAARPQRPARAHRGGVGYARITAVLAAMAGAEAVLAIGRDTPQASRKDAEQQTGWLAAVAGVQDRVRFFPSRLQAPLATVDLVTDLPGVRPIDETLTRNLPDTAVVAIMGRRPLAPGRRGRGHLPARGHRRGRRGRGRPGLVPRPRHGSGVGPAQPGRGRARRDGAGRRRRRRLRARGSGARGAARPRAGAAPGGAGRIELYGGRKVGDALADAGAMACLPEADALVLCPSSPEQRWFGPGGLDAARLAAAAPHLAVVSQGGESDRLALAGAGLRTWPRPRPGPDPGALFELVPAAHRAARRRAAGRPGHGARAPARLVAAGGGAGRRRRGARPAAPQGLARAH